MRPPRPVHAWTIAISCVYVALLVAATISWLTIHIQQWQQVAPNLVAELIAVGVGATLFKWFQRRSDEAKQREATRDALAELLPPALELCAFVLDAIRRTGAIVFHWEDDVNSDQTPLSAFIEELPLALFAVNWAGEDPAGAFLSLAHARRAALRAVAADFGRWYQAHCNAVSDIDIEVRRGVEPVFAFLRNGDFLLDAIVSFIEQRPGWPPGVSLGQLPKLASPDAVTRLVSPLGEFLAFYASAAVRYGIDAPSFDLLWDNAL